MEKSIALPAATAPTEGVAMLRFRSYREGDEGALIDLMNRVFGDARSPDHWRWKFRESPHGEALIAVAEGAGGSVVGHWAILPTKLNYAGVPVRAGQSVDMCLDPAQSHPAFFSKMTALLLDASRERGLQAIFTFPNRKSWGIVHLGWRRLGHFVQYGRRLGIRSGVRRLLPVPGVPLLSDLAFRAVSDLDRRLATAWWGRRLRAPWRVEFSPSPPEDYGRFWDAYRFQEILCLWKDAAYLKWRYESHPSRKFVFASLRVSDELRGLAVLAVDGEEARLGELMVLDHQVAAGRVLLESLRGYARRRGADRLTFSGLDGGFFDGVFEGFTRSTAFHGPLFLKAQASQPQTEAALYTPQNWTWSVGDTDS